MDLYLFNLINQFALRWEWFDTLAIAIAKYLGYVLVFCLLLFLIANFRKYLKMVIQAIIASVLARFAVVTFIRWLLPRPRPFINNSVNLLFENNGSSFPSGHAAFFFALSFIVYLYNKKIGALFFLATILICLARVFAGIHWPSDILAGAIIGLLTALVIKKGAKLFF